MLPKQSDSILIPFAIRFVLLSLPYLASLSAASAGPVPATAEDLRGVVAIEKCSGAIVALGSDEKQPASFLSAGHCGKPGYAIAPGKAVSAEGRYWNHVRGFPEGASLEHPAKITLSKLAYATMTRVDLSIFSTASSVEDFRKQGYRVFSLADSLPRPGDRLRVTSAFWKETQLCRVEKILETNTDESAIDPTSIEGYEFRRSILFDSDCIVRTGWSGAPVFEESTGRIFGVVSRRILAAARIPFGALEAAAKFVAWDFQDRGSGVLIASNVADLGECLTATGELRFGAACLLPKTSALSEAERERAPPPPSRNSTPPRTSAWPK
jgi:hypothetical protein